MSDRPTLANAIEDAGIERTKAERIASTIVDLIHDNVATKADIERLAAVTKADIERLAAVTKADIEAGAATLRAEAMSLRGEMHSGFARQDVAIEQVRSTVREMESQITLRLGGIVAAGVAIVVAAQHFWPPPH